MTTLITGGAGFIGNHLAIHLLAQNKPVVLLDNFDDYYDPTIKRARIANMKGDVPVIEGDIRDIDVIEKVFREHHITRVANMAALPGVRYSVGRAQLYLEVNTTAAVNLMDVASKHDVEVFVQASTSSVYGHTNQIPFKEEDAADRPLAPYPASKRASELFGHTFYNLHGLNVTVLRFFNVYGPYGRPDMMPEKALKSIIEGKPITLWNGGNIKRDWTYVDDTVRGVALALDKPMGYEVLNLGFGHPIALIDFINIYEELVGKEAIKNIADAPLTEPLITYCDNTRAQNLLGFKPQIQIETGLTNVWNWYREVNGL